MPAPGSVWDADTWDADAWAADTWADAQEAVAGGSMLLMGAGAVLWLAVRLLWSYRGGMTNG